jgi:HAD superfamily hydrolase (TIGR01458 family)
MARIQPKVQGVLLDVDGVLHVGMSPLPGAAATLRWLGENNYPFRCVTNTTTSARSTLTRALQAIGLPIEQAQLITAPVATASYIRQVYPGKRCWLLTKGDTAEDFADIELVDERADVVVIGGAEELLSYETMNRAFRMLMEGADLLAMHSNLYWKTSAGLQLDSGPYVYALERASGKQATVLGKPNRAFFEQALLSLNLPASAAIMLGDDLENDVQAAQQVGLRGLFVTTGKHTPDSPLLAHVHPDAVLSSIGDLPNWLLERVRIEG